MMTDPISDMLTRIRNAIAVNKVDFDLPYSNMKYAIAKIFEKEGYITSAKKGEKGKFPVIEIVLKYEGKKPSILSLKRISKPGCRVYAKSDELPRVMADSGIAVISTPNGVMSNKEARSRKLGGEVICEVY